MHLLKLFSISTLVLLSNAVQADPQPVPTGTGKAVLTILVVDTQANKIVNRTSWDYATLQDCSYIREKMNKDIVEKHYPVIISCLPRNMFK